MATIRQVHYIGHIKKKFKIKSRALNKCPQKRGICRQIILLSPRKPNSARRKVIKVLLSNKMVVYVYIPGEGHNLQKFSQILVRGGKIPDLPGVAYTAIRGILDFQGAYKRRQGRSKYGVPQLKL